MARHNKWAQIKHKKAVVDAKRSKIFSMLTKLITVETRRAGNDKNYPGLRAVIERARAANMPNDNIERAINRASGLEKDAYEEVFYEAYGPGGVALIIEGITDNKNRTTSEIKHLLTEGGGSLGGQGSAVWAFTKINGGWQAHRHLTLSPADSYKLQTLLQTLDRHDDIKNIYHNADL